MPDSIVGQLVDKVVEVTAEATVAAGEAAVEFAKDTAAAIVEKYGEIDTAVSRETVQTIPADDVSRIAAALVTSPDVLSYPVDINNDPQNPDNEFLHSVVFKILARSNSRVGQVATAMNTGSVTQAKVFDTTDQNRVSSESGELYLSSLGGLAAATTGYAATKKILSGNTGSGAGEFVKAGTLGLLGVAAGQLATENTSLLELRTAIELVVTAPPKVTYSAEWENAEIGATGGSLARGEGGISKMGILSGAAGLGELGIRGAIGAAASLPAGAGLSGDLAAGIDATSKKTSNPYKEQLFKFIDFRRFEFAYKFAPRNMTELDNVMRIIQKFKYHMHPENSKTKLFLEYPSEFNIEYRYRGSRNQYVNKISTCALTNMEVNYGNQDSFTSFADTNGAPAEINLLLRFTELETLTNDRIGLDYKDSF
jgi:hypothetical protein